MRSFVCLLGYIAEISQILQIISIPGYSMKPAKSKTNYKQNAG